MPDDTQDAKAQKLAAARKKLKEYQQRSSGSSNNNNIIEEHASTNTNTNSSTVSIASNLSERSDCELSPSNGTGSGGGTGTHQTAPVATPTSVAAYFGEQPLPVVEPEPQAPSQWAQNGQGDTNLHTIQVLIAEKAQLNTELTKFRHVCRERELELEEIRIEHVQTVHRLEGLQQRCQDQESSAEQQRNHNAELQHKLALAQAKIDDQQMHLGEVEAQLKQQTIQENELQQQHVNTCNELDMAQLRLRQLSDESNVNADNRIETLTQTQYMYEQQIRDLQQMVTQLTQDKEQASIQYQNYAASLNERNTELGEECEQLKDRERQLVEHVSSLERDIQKNLALQAQYKDAANQQLQQLREQPEVVSTADHTELVALKERISDFEFEQHEYQLKIKSQNDQLQLKEDALVELQQELHRLQTEQPDQVKLMATIESDKVAASRALSQNVEMKQQLDELQLRFVQLTNDKLELVNKLDSEEFANREIRLNYVTMEQKLQANEERYKFKDDEMIRLSHENVELQRTHLIMQQQLDRLHHYEANYRHDPKEVCAETAVTDGSAEAQEHDHKHMHDHEHDNHHHREEHSNVDHLPSNETPLLPTAEAVEKLQSRFTTLISQVADLTEEKHNLEHLVLQLQGETETIGEYIALYQTQRRMLKQREYEKTTQMRLLKAEREQLREKIDALNKLVGSLGLAVELPTDQLQSATDASAPTEVRQLSAGKNAAKENENSQQILHKIQDIITEIKENADQLPTSLSSAEQPGNAVDHLNCCLGKFEVV